MVNVTTTYLPEGSLLDTPENNLNCGTLDALLRAVDGRYILEGRALSCDAGRNLSVKVGNFTGVIPRGEAALGITEGRTREIAILSRVGKPVCFVVTGMEMTEDGEPRPILSRCQAQALALAQMLSTFVSGQIIDGVVTHLEPFGAFVDIGCGVPSMIGIEHISISRLPHPAQRFWVGQPIRAVVTGLDLERGRVLLTHKELLGTWEENVAQLTPGMTVPGYVRSIKEYGAFIELTPNLSGLAELRPGYEEGDRVSVYIKAILAQQMKLKLLLIDRLPPEKGPPPMTYFITEGPLGHWRYAPEACTRPGAESHFMDCP